MPQAVAATSRNPPLNVGVSAFVIVQKAQRILLLRRAGTGWMDGHFSLPAGRLDSGETLAQAAARELQEETGLVTHATDLRLIHMLHARAGDHGGAWMGAFFLASQWQGEACIAEPHKHDQLIWASAEAWPDTLIPYVRQALVLGLAGIPYSDVGWA